MVTIDSIVTRLLRYATRIRNNGQKNLYDEAIAPASTERYGNDHARSPKRLIIFWLTRTFLLYVTVFAYFRTDLNDSRVLEYFRSIEFSPGVRHSKDRRANSSLAARIVSSHRCIFYFLFFFLVFYTSPNHRHTPADPRNSRYLRLPIESGR